MGGDMKAVVRWALGCALASGLTLPALASVSYVYSGHGFVNVSPPYTTSDSVSGQLTLASALAPDLTSLTAVSPLSFSISDGPETISNSTPGVGSEFLFKTDASGAITAWAVVLDVTSVYDFSIATVDSPGVYGVYDSAQHGGGTEEGIVENQAGVWSLASAVPESPGAALGWVGASVVVLLALRRRSD